MQLRSVATKFSHMSSYSRELLDGDNIDGWKKNNKNYIMRRVFLINFLSHLVYVYININFCTS